MPGAGGVIDSFFISLGFRVDQSGAKQLKRNVDDAKSSLLSLGTAVKAAIGGFVVKAIADVGDQFERNQNIIAGFLTSLGFASDFNQGLKVAESTMESITLAAAKLPGEANEYIEVFRAGLPVLKGAMPGGSLKAITDFSNTFTAIGKSLDVDAAQIGRDLGLVLGPTGRAGAQVLTFQRMLPLLQQLDGQAKLNSESFNKMTQPERLKLLQEAMASPGMVAMLARSATSFDAMLGAAKSMVKTLLRTGTKGLFEGMKQGLDEIRALFIDDNGRVTELGKSFAEAGKEVSRVVVQLLSMFGGFVKWVLKSEAAMKLLKGALVVVGIALGALALQQTVGWLGKMFTAVFNLKKLLLGGLLVAIVLIAEDIYTFLTGGESVIGMLMEKFPIATKAAIFALGLLGAAFVALRVKALIELGLLAAKSLTAGAAIGRGLTAAMGPLGALILALTTLYGLLELADEKFGITDKLLAAGGVGGPPSAGSFSRTAPGTIKDFKAGIGVTGLDPKTGQAKFSKAPSTLKTWTPNMGYAGGGSGDGVSTPQSGTTVNVGDVTIKSDNPRDAGRAFMNTVRDAQSKVSH